MRESQKQEPFFVVLLSLNDIDLLKDLRMDAYRFSISWSRIFTRFVLQQWHTSSRDAIHGSTKKSPEICIGEEVDAGRQMHQFERRPVGINH
ncbi:predicted protein [Arabidopsis lyrata subsp. lyrata]|uniref:Predicted protein n=1 Tax=Arabidopsis lyrata subsp. lyrata TaxID=81972 RepID=D7MUB3_ARALL|nr:predicted protein [Arabidopsis lyrata subsp. lyrata]